MSAIGIYNGNSDHMRRLRSDNLEALFAQTIPLRRHLEIYLMAAENKMRNGLNQATGDMWTRGWELYKELSDQIALLDEVTK
jgi:hypothetical protein